MPVDMAQPAVPIHFRVYEVAVAARMPKIAMVTGTSTKVTPSSYMTSQLPTHGLVIIVDCHMKLRRSDRLSGTATK
ncbi:hypothetical protein acdb102_26230 [Acidothermaceae bacterium B102]|nr:hypothetical protein acdb102_26230 [Acidothermaceae bacterium B102]